MDIITQCQQGDLSKFQELYLQHVEGVYKFIYFKTHHQPTTEDLTSITFIKAMENIKQFKPKKASFKTWLYQIARHNVIDHYRKHQEVKNIEDIWDLSSSENIEQDAHAKIKLEAIREYMQTLKPEQREVIILRLWGDHSFAEIAEITGKSEAACKMNFKRTLEKIKNEFPAFALLILLTQPL